jgi:recombination endonuclease VII
MAPQVKMCKECGKRPRTGTSILCSQCRYAKNKLKPCIRCGKPRYLQTTFCKDCFNKYERERKKKGGIKDGGLYQQKYRLKRVYGLSEEEYRALTKDGCHLCGSHSRLCVDHDHATGEVRGALCYRCNTAIGALGDTVEGLQRTLNYLSKDRILRG